MYRDDFTLFVNEDGTNWVVAFVKGLLSLGEGSLEVVMDGVVSKIHFVLLYLSLIINSTEGGASLRPSWLTIRAETISRWMVRIVRVE